MNFYGKQSVAGSRMNMSKTGGMVEIKDLKHEDKYIGTAKFVQDEFNRQDFEIQQLDPEKVKNVKKFVESLVTGQFHSVKDDFDPNQDMNLAQVIDVDGDGIVSTQELNDYQMKLQQSIWVNRINKVYNMTLGLLGGMGLMHIIFIAAQPDKKSFYKTYSEFGNLICIMTQLLTNFTLIFGLSLTLIYKNISDDKMRNLDPDRSQFKEQYILGLVTQGLVFLSWILLHIQPKYSNKLYFLNESSFTDADYTSFKIICYMADTFLLVSWLVASIYNKAAIESITLDPEDRKDKKKSGQRRNDDQDLEEEKLAAAS